LKRVSKDKWDGYMITAKIASKYIPLQDFRALSALYDDNQEWTTKSSLKKVKKWRRSTMERNIEIMAAQP
jgi:hypothetical protein